MRANKYEPASGEGVIREAGPDGHAAGGEQAERGQRTQPPAAPREPGEPGTAAGLPLTFKTVLPMKRL